MACSSTGLTRVTISGSGSALRRKTCADRRSSRRTGGQPRSRVGKLSAVIRVMAPRSDCSAISPPVSEVACRLVPASWMQVATPAAAPQGNGTCGSGGWAVGDDDPNLLRRVTALHGQLYAVARFGVVERRDELLRRWHVLSVDRGDHVAG